MLTVDRLTREGVFTDISLTVRSGEIVALAGLVGAGRSEVARAIFGIDRYDAGKVTVHGKHLKKASPTSAMAAGIGFVPEDRQAAGPGHGHVRPAERGAGVPGAPATRAA